MAPEKKRKRNQETSSIPTKLKPTSKSAPESSNKRLKPSADSKPSTKPAPAAVVPSTLKASTDEETSFPRGGASALTPLEYKEVANEAMKDALFEAGGSASANAMIGGGESVQKKKKPRRNDKKGGKKGETKEKKEKGPKIEGLSYKVWLYFYRTNVALRN
jgi:rRNA biogenesis protein RRP5